MQNRIKLTALFLLLGFSSTSLGKSDLMNAKIISKKDHKVVATFKVEIAETPQATELGLMYRKSLKSDHGMLFIFSQPRHGHFWMKNTYIPLDIIFLDSNKKIVSIVHQAQPLTTTPRFAEGAFQYVLEVNGGLSKKLGIRPGDRVDW